MQMEKGKKKPSVVLEENSDDDDANALTACDLGTKICDNWILDSRCSYHISSNKEWSSSYEVI